MIIRLLLHAKHASDVGNHNAVMRTSDTDVMVLAVYFQSDIEATLIFVNMRVIKEKLGPDICEALPGLHAVSGCDTTSAFYGKTKHAFFQNDGSYSC